MSNELYHHGIKGMRWGVRRYQNEDGTLTDKGVRRYVDYKSGGLTKKGKKRLDKVGSDSIEGKHLRRMEMEANVYKNWHKSYNKASEEWKPKLDEINKRFGDKADVNNREYVKAVGKSWVDTYSKRLISDFGRDPITNGTDWVRNAPLMSEDL